MTRSSGPVAEIFRALVAQGHITPVEHMESMRLPGEYTHVPNVLGYGTPDIQACRGGNAHAQLGFCAEGNQQRADK